ncbi:phage holin family protein [Nocardioides insulae]|uniref:phage holin family protein n=1 Tax=Nocardioides insulae TaxID=394734 RepID=UPI00048DFDBE|nr:phage holin family protein [Nocardioides insulae]
MRLIAWLLTNVIALAVATWMLDGIWFAGPTGDFQAEFEEKWLPLVIVALILGLVSAVVKPVVKLLSLPLIVLTLGLFLVVINALMLQLTDWLSDLFDLGFEVDGFWTAVAGGLIISLVTWGVDVLLGDD